MAKTKRAKRVGLTIEQFMGMVSAPAESTRENYRKLLTTCEEFLGKPLARATEKDAARLKAWLLKTKKAAFQYNTVLRMFYKRINKEDPRLDYFNLKRPDDKLIPPSQVITPEHVEALVDACDSMRDRALVGALWDSAGRIAELLALNIGPDSVRERTAENGNGGPREFVCWLGKMKERGTEHEVYIRDSYPLMKEWLEHYYPPTKDPNAPLFPTYTGNRLSPRNDGWRVVDRIAKRAKHLGTIPHDLHIHPHAFRHGRITYLLRRGMPEFQVKMRVGLKKNSKMLARYAHLVAEDVHDAELRAEGFNVPKRGGMEPPRFENLRPALPLVPPPGTDAAAGLNNLQARVNEVVERAVGGVLEKLNALGIPLGVAAQGTLPSVGIKVIAVDRVRIKQAPAEDPAKAGGAKE